MEAGTMKSIPQDLPQEQAPNDRISAFVDAFGIRQALRKAHACKARGVPVLIIFQYLLRLVFTRRSMYMDMQQNNPGFSQDAVYRLLNSIHIHWQKFLSLVAAFTIRQHIERLTSENRINVLIVDDTFYGRERSKKVELLTKVCDHSKKRFARGFRLLTLGWSDGNTFLPFTYCPLTSEEPEKRFCGMRPVDGRTIGYHNRMQAMTKAPAVMLKMLRQAKTAGIPSNYVLFDSWFSFPSTIMAVQQIGFHTICRVKSTSKIHYTCDGCQQPLNKIYRNHRKRPGRARYLLSVPVTLTNDQGETTPARVVFVRDRNNRKKWIALLSTDMNLPEEEIIRIYGKRWSIEVFFKMCKSYLRLGTEFQGLSFDSMVAHVAIVMTRYIILAWEHRSATDQRTFGEIFFFAFDEARDIQFQEAFAILLELLLNEIGNSLEIPEHQIDLLLTKLINTLPALIRNLLNRGYKKCSRKVS